MQCTFGRLRDENQQYVFEECMPLKQNLQYKGGCQGSRCIWGLKNAEGRNDRLHTNRRKKGGTKEKTGRNNLCLIAEGQQEQTNSALLQKVTQEQTNSALLQEDHQEQTDSALLQKAQQNQTNSALLQKAQQDQTNNALLQKAQQDQTNSALLQKATDILLYYPTWRTNCQDPS